MGVVTLSLIFVSITARWEEIYDASSTYPIPSTRQGHTLVLFRRTLVVFGGREQTEATCDLASYDAGNCGIRKVDPLLDPSIRLNTDLNYNCKDKCNDNGWCAHFEKPVKRSYCVCYDDYTGMFCEKRVSQEYKNDIWYWDLDKKEWFGRTFTKRAEYKISDYWPWPRQRYKHQAIVLEDGRVHGHSDTKNWMFIYGGISDLCVDFCRDMWAWDLDLFLEDRMQNSWWDLGFVPDLNNSPYERWGHNMVIDKKRNNKVILFGGHRRQQYLRDIRYYFFDKDDWSNDPYELEKGGNSNKYPLSRIGAAMALNDSDQGTLFLYGGYHSTKADEKTHESRFLTDLWLYTTHNTTWKYLFPAGLVEPDDPVQTTLNFFYKTPYRRRDAQLHVQEHLIFLFGGYADNWFFNDTWRFSKQTHVWVQHLPPYYTEEDKDYWLDRDPIFATKMDRWFWRPGPPHRAAHKWVWVPFQQSEGSHIPMNRQRGAMYMFGGYGMYTNVEVTKHMLYKNDLWMLNFSMCPNDCNVVNEPVHECYFQHCRCNSTFSWGKGCERRSCPGTKCIYHNDTWEEMCEHCNNRGQCHTDIKTNTGFCHCQEGYTGESCEWPFCVNDTKTRQYAVNNPLGPVPPLHLQCNGGTTGKCYERGMGRAPKCICDKEWFGENCDHKWCPNNCTSRNGEVRGYCQFTKNGSYPAGTCICGIPKVEGRMFVGIDCARTIAGTGQLKTSNATILIFIIIILILLLFL